MARRTISFDAVSLQDSTYQIQEIEHESVDHREINIQRLGRKEGGKFISDTFAPRIIRVRGRIAGSSIDDLEDKIDDLKELLNRKEKNLDIQYASGTRRFIASCNSFKIIRAHYHITFAPFEASFLIGNPPFGQAIDTSTAEFNGLNAGTTNSNFTASGTYKPMPIIKMIVNSETAMTQISFTNTNTGQTITVTPASGFTAADILLINTDDYTVTLNGTAIDYTGYFPEFVQGGNNFKFVVWSQAHNIDLRLIYRPLFL